MATFRLAELQGRFAAAHGHVLHHYDAGGRFVERPMPSVAEDVWALARRLAGIGVGVGARVGVLAENGYEVVLLDLALIQLGAVSVFFSETQANVPADELAGAYGLALLVASPRLMAFRTDAPPWLVPIDRLDLAGVARRAYFVVDDDPDTGSLIFSSGTSGHLKCMRTSRSGTEVAIEEFSDAYRFDARDRMLVFLPLSSFQQRVMVYAALMAGMDLVIADPQRVFHALRTARPSVVCGPPMLWEGISARAKDGGLAAKVAFLRRVPLLPLRRRLAAWLLPHTVRELGGQMRVLMTGMAPIKPATHDLFEALGAPLYEYYGLTECGNIALNRLDARRVGTVGVPVQPGCVVLATDGEILVRKPVLVTRGYTVEGEAENARVYRADGLIATGDLGCFDDDGFLRLIGRKKEIIVTAGGTKISPEDLEAKLGGSSDVARAVVFGGDAIDGIAAVIVLAVPDDPGAPARVQAYVDRMNAAATSPYHVTRLVFTDRSFDAASGLLTRNLKIDRRAVFATFSPQLTARAGGAPCSD